MMTTVNRLALRITALLAVSAAGCSGHISIGNVDSGEERDGGGQDSDGGSEPGSSEDGGSEPGSDGGGQSDGGGGGSDAGSSQVPVNTGEVDPNAPANTGLPPVPRLSSVSAKAIGDSVSITFDPVEGAADYRVYELPDASNVSATADGHVTVKNAVYRCAGNRQAPKVASDNEPEVTNESMRTRVESDVHGYKRTLAQATLGYVYQEAGSGRVPVYAVGEPGLQADNVCFAQRWSASRQKQYVTSSATRDMLIKRGGRDDGVAFYVPAAGAGGTRQVFTKIGDEDSGARLYYTEGAEASARGAGTAAFSVLTTQAEGTVPLMRVYYDGGCGGAHDELAAGKPRFELARRQGDKLPVTRLHWSGLTKSTTLVVEALDQGCPYPGLLAPKAAPRATDEFGNVYEAWVTPETAQAASPTKELYINGQFEGTKPKPIARSFIKIGPAAAPDLDWSFGYKASDTLGNFTPGASDPLGCVTHERARSSAADTSFYCADDNFVGQRSIFGEWWVMFTDVAADTNGKYRLTANTKADLKADSFLYVSMDVDSLTTLRRYPQIMVSDQDVPVQHNLEKGNTLILQTFGDWPYKYEIQICDHRTWDVNQQCPRFSLFEQLSPTDKDETVGLAPNVEVGDQTGLDYSNRWEWYVSTRRAYAFFDGQPYGCVDFPTKGVPSGAVTVTFGDVLYHSGIDDLFDFTSRKMQTVSGRHFDNMGFKNHVAAPAWDESRFPCAKHLTEE
ncbi:MAG TPA: hypothetical protein VFZ61_07520 [Polyangiales bacterium]